MHNYNMNYYNSIDNTIADSQGNAEGMLMTPWMELDSKQINYVHHQLKKIGMYSLYENLKVNKTTDAIKSINSALYYIFEENEKFAAKAMSQPEGFYFSDEKAAQMILLKIFEHPFFDKTVWENRKNRKASQLLNDITRMPDLNIGYYQENKQVYEKRKKQTQLARQTALDMNLERKLNLYFTNPNIVNTRDYEIFENKKYPKSFLII